MGTTCISLGTLMHFCPQKITIIIHNSLIYKSGVNMATEVESRSKVLEKSKKLFHKGKIHTKKASISFIETKLATSVQQHYKRTNLTHSNACQGYIRIKYR